MKKYPPLFQRFTAAAFSLVELLVVVAIIGILLGLVLPAVNGFGRSSALTTGGNLVVSVINLARQEAVTKNTLTAVVLLGNQPPTAGQTQPPEQNFRALTVLEFDAVTGWSQVGNWEILPVGIVVDRSDTVNCTFLTNSPTTLPFLNSRFSGQKDSLLTFEGSPVSLTNCYLRVFMANGALQNPEQAAQLRLVEGFIQGNQVVYTSHQASGHIAANYYDVAIIGMTGTSKITRP